jgi:hypothetical protein
MAQPRLQTQYGPPAAVVTTLPYAGQPSQFWHACTIPAQAKATPPRTAPTDPSIESTSRRSPRQILRRHQ